MNSPKKKTFNEQTQTIPEVERRFSVITKFTTNVEAKPHPCRRPSPIGNLS